LFGNPYLEAPATTVGDEQRWLAVGMIDDVYVMAARGSDEDVCRISTKNADRSMGCFGLWIWGFISMVGCAIIVAHVDD
jgi:hypothetical protein